MFSCLKDRTWRSKIGSLKGKGFPIPELYESFRTSTAARDRAKMLRKAGWDHVTKRGKEVCAQNRSFVDCSICDIPWKKWKYSHPRSSELIWHVQEVMFEGKPGWFFARIGEIFGCYEFYCEECVRDAGEDFFFECCRYCGVYCGIKSKTQDDFLAPVETVASVSDRIRPEIGVVCDECNEMYWEEYNSLTGDCWQCNKRSAADEYGKYPDHWLQFGFQEFCGLIDRRVPDFADHLFKCNPHRVGYPEVNLCSKKCLVDAIFDATGVRPCSCCGEMCRGEYCSRFCMNQDRLYPEPSENFNPKEFIENVLTKNILRGD